MRWEDERYVRFYTRDTPEWLALSWQARGLAGLLLRAVDRAGVLKVGKLGMKGAAVAVHAPWVEVEGPLRELLADGCIVWDEAKAAFFVPNFLEAQECAQSDRARKRASRERARTTFGVDSNSAAESAREVTNRDGMESQTVTPSGHETGQKVTIGHDGSHAVTPTLPVPTRALDTPNGVSAAPNGASAKTRNTRPADPALDALRLELMAAYRATRGEELDWPRSAWGDLQAIRKALADDAEVKRRWGLFLETKFWPIKSVHKFRDAFPHAKFQASPSPALPDLPSIPVFR